MPPAPRRGRHCPLRGGPENVPRKTSSSPIPAPVDAPLAKEPWNTTVSPPGLQLRSSPSCFRCLFQKLLFCCLVACRSMLPLLPASDQFQGCSSLWDAFLFGPPAAAGSRDILPTLRWYLSGKPAQSTCPICLCYCVSWHAGRSANVPHLPWLSIPAQIPSQTPPQDGMGASCYTLRGPTDWGPAGMRFPNQTTPGQHITGRKEALG